jgi:TolA-binding protein
MLASPRFPARAVVPALVLLVLSGCAYYNTFYLAKKYYGEAEKEQEKVTENTISPAAITKYEATVRQCNKLLHDYPKSKYVDDAAYLLGASYYGRGDYSEALRRMDDFLTHYPKSPFVPDGQLIKGLTHYRLKDYPQADSVFRSVDKKYPRFRQKWALYYYWGETQAAMKHYEPATGWYRRAFKAGEDRRERGLALTRLGDALASGGRDDSAAVVYTDAMKVEQRASERFDIAMKRGEVLMRLKRYPEALDFYRGLRPLAPAEHREGELELRIDECLGTMGRVEDAIAGYRTLIQEKPHTNVAYEAQFEIGYLYESQLNDFDAAAREYDKLKAEPPSTFADQAARRARNLSALKNYRAKVEGDSTQAAARTAFLLGELYYFQLSRVDSAFRQYGLVEKEYPLSPYAPKAGYARLWIATQDKDDTTEAAALTDSIVRRYRGTDYAESALNLWKNWSGRTDWRTVLLDSLLQHPDTSMAAVYRVTEPAPPPDTVAVQDTTEHYQPRTYTAAQVDSINKVKERWINEGMAPHRGKRKHAYTGKSEEGAEEPDTGGADEGAVPEPLGPPAALGPPGPASTPPPADTTRSVAPPPAPPDTTRAAPPPAPPPDSSRAAPPDTAAPHVVTPSR